MLLFCSTARGQAVSPSPINPTPSPLAETASKSESVSVGLLQEIEASLSSDRTTTTIERELPLLTSEIDILFRDGARILRSNPSGDILYSMTTGLKTLDQDLSRWNSDLARRASELSREAGRLNEMRSKWMLTQQQAQSSGTSPPLLRRIEHLIAAAGQTLNDIHSEKAQIVNDQDRIAEQQGLIADARDEVEQARRRIFDRLLVQDDPPIWTVNPSSDFHRNLIQELGILLAPEPTALRAYVERRMPTLLVPLIIFGLLLVALCLARRPVRKWTDLRLQHATAIFETPVSTAIVLSILLSASVFAQAPRSLREIFGLVALIPTTIVLRRLIEQRLLPILSALIAFWFVDLLRAFATPLPILSRWLLLGEILAAILFLWWLIRSPPGSNFKKAQDDHFQLVIKSYAFIALMVFGVAFVVGALGYVNLANLASSAVLRSAYLAIVLYAGIRIVDGLIQTLMQVRPLVLLGIVRRHGPMLGRRASLALQWIALLIWLSVTVQSLGLGETLSEMMVRVLGSTLTLGSIHLSLGQVLACVITVWASFLFSSFIRFLLEEDIYERFQITRGLPYAISTLLHYVVLLVGFFIGVAVIGVDMTKVTILAGAFTVGVGFGLQNIINNFVSGIILLFERPIKVGDLIQVGDATGVVKRIGVRACVIRTNEGSDIIVPNAKLISDQLANWTFSDLERAIVIPLSTAHDADPGQVMELVERVAAAHPLIIKKPPPQAFLVNFGPGPLSFELRAWTNIAEEWMQTRSELSVAINAALAQRGLRISDPKRPEL